MFSIISQQYLFIKIILKSLLSGLLLIDLIPTTKN